MGPRGGATSYRDQNNHRNTNSSNYRNNNNNNNQDQQEIDNWDPASTQVANDNGKNEEAWGDLGDWDNEEYTGSLTDTKVFTPSGATSGQDLAAPPGLEQQVLNPPSQNDVAQYSTTVVSSTSTAGALNNGGGQYGEMHSTNKAAAQLRQALEMPQALSAEQSQYFNTLGSQNTGSGYASAVQYPFNDQVGGNQQAPRQQQQRPRARVPPPSKIPSTAVEMPGDGLNVYLGGVQFGELDFGTGTEESYEPEKYAPGMDPSAGDDYSNKGTGVSKGSQSGGLGGLNPSITDSISSSAQADLSSGYAQRNPNVGSAMGTAGGQSALDQLTKPADIYNSGTTAGGNAYQNMNYQASQKSGGYQTSGYNAYNPSQTSSNYPPPSSNNYGTYNQNSYQSQGTQSGTGQQQTQTTGSSVSGGANNQPVNNNSSR